MKHKKPFKIAPLHLKDALDLRDTLYFCYYDTNINIDTYLIALMETVKSIAYEEGVDFQMLLKAYLQKE